MGSSQAVVRGGVCCLHRWDNLAKVMFAQGQAERGWLSLMGSFTRDRAHSYWGRLKVFLTWFSQQRDGIYVCDADVPPRPPKLLITAPYFKPRSGGLEEYAYQIAKGLQETKGWEVTVVASGDKDEVRMSGYQGIKVYYLPYRLTLSNTPFGFGWRGALKRIISTERPDVIVAHGPVPGMLDVAVGRAKKRPFVVTYHSGSMVKGRLIADLLIKCYEKVLLPRALRKARLIICASRFVQRSEMIAPHFDKTTVINPSVDTDFFRPRSQRVHGHRIMHVGGLKVGEEYRGLDISLQVTAELRKMYPDVHLMVAGNGDKQVHYEAVAEQLGVASHVKFCGRLGPNELLAVYQSANVLITPSRKEAFGMALIEAMACGVPVVASAAEGIPDVVDDGEVGFLIEPGDVSGFVAGISKLFDDPALWMHVSENARRTAVARENTWPRQVERTAEILRALI
jgi:glycosyltransferase involved in cell wall biosynthesis